MDLPGKFGTIALLRAMTGEVVTSFGIDTTALSFGRDPTCGVRLYYPDVAPVHARIVFTPLDNSTSTSKPKAFLEVLGAAGVILDGCLVYPHPEPAAAPKTIALGNGSEVEIHAKRFKFTYPPKDADIRAAMAATPPRPPNRALRLSMIASAQVFSPRPSHDPRQNLRVLQSPLRLPPAFSPSPSPSKSKPKTPPGRSPSKSPTKSFATTVSFDPDSSSDEEDENEEAEEITLVQGAHPRVVEEASDLVILEDVEVPLPVLTRPPPPAPPRTPRRQSLHRAVLIRSAQRAVLNARRPVPVPSFAGPTAAAPAPSPIRGWTAPAPNPGSAQAESDSDSDEDEEAEIRSLRLEVVSVSSGSETDEDEGEYENEVEQDNAQEEGQEGGKQSQPRLGWRKSLEKLKGWAWGAGVKEEEEEVTIPAGAENAEEEDEMQEERTAREDEMQSPTRAPVPASTPKQASAPAWITRFNDAPPPASVSPRKTVSRSVSPEKQQRSTSPQKSNAAEPSVSLESPQTPKQEQKQKQKTPPMTPFGAPHPDAQRPAGFGAKRKSVGPQEKDKAQEVPMDVDAEGYTPLYEDLSIYRAAQETPRQEKEKSPAGAKGEENREQEGGVTAAVTTEKPRPLATTFMTPQPARRVALVDAASASGPGAAPASASSRYSLGGAARRVPVQNSPWKVRDLVAPQPSAAPTTPVRNAPHPSTPRISDEERRAISERRRSALTAPDTFFQGGVPGMSPVKRGMGLGRVKEEGAGGEGGNEKAKEKEENKEQAGAPQDARSLLANLKETVEGLKRRRESVLAVAGRASSDERKESEDEPMNEIVPRESLIPVPVDETEAQAEAQPAVTPKATRGRSPAKKQQEEDSGKCTRKTTAEPESQQTREVDEPTPAPAKPARRTRKAATAAELSEAEPAVEEMAVDIPAPAPAKPARRGRKATAEPQSEDEVPALPVITPAPSKPRRGRKASAEPESDNDSGAAVPAAPTRRPRKPPSITVDTAPASEPAAPPKRAGRVTRATTPASAPERKTRGKSRAHVEEDDAEAEADPLDTIVVEEEEEVAVVEVVPPKRRARSAKPKVKEEEPEAVVLETEGTAVPARAGRGKKAAASSAAPAVPKPRSTRKGAVPASAPAAIETVDKENAPDEEEGEPAVKVTRVSRSRKVKEEVVEPEMTVPRRATRTRTRT